MCSDLNPGTLKQVFKLNRVWNLKILQEKDQTYLARERDCFDVHIFPAFSVIKNQENELGNWTT